MNELALFAGAGGGILGGWLLGWRTACAVEIDAYCRSVLLARQRDGCLPQFPIWDDVRTFDGRQWRGLIDVISGGFPCQDISAAGRGAGITGAKSGLWKEMARIIGEVRPHYVFVENSQLLVRRGLAVVLGDFAEMGYDARWGVLGADDVGAPHKRERIWIVANADMPGRQRQDLPQPEGRVEEAQPTRTSNVVGDRQERNGRPVADNGGWWDVEPRVGRVAYGVANGLDRVRVLGQGQVPAVVKAAWEALIGNLGATNNGH